MKSLCVRGAEGILDALMEARRPRRVLLRRTMNAIHFCKAPKPCLEDLPDPPK